ncbi:MAG: hypothetical protein ACTHMZ_11925 [Actinomycetes bacterium]
MAASLRAALPGLLARRSAAAVNGDSAAFVTDVDAGQPDFAARQRTLAAAVGQLVSASRHVSDHSAAAGGPSWTWRFGGDVVVLTQSRALARIVESYRLPPWQPEVEQREQWWVLSRRDGRWVVAGDTDPAGRHVSQRDVWDLAPVTVAATPRVLLVDASTDTPRTPTLLRLAQQAEQRAEKVLPPGVWHWPGAVLVERPRDDRAAAELAGMGTEPDRQDGEPDAVSGLAAVTVGRPLQPQSRVVLVPTTVTAMSASDTVTVLSHELAHVATRPVTRAPVPLWLTEGYADWVALDDAPVAQGAPVALRRGQQGWRPPLQPPADVAFTSPPSSNDLALTYELSWLSVRGLVQRLGAPSTAGLYREVAAGTPLSQALARRGLTVGDVAQFARAAVAGPP